MALGWPAHLFQHGADADVHAGLDAQFTQKEQMNLTPAISMINCWNQLAISFRKMPDA